MPEISVQIEVLNPKEIVRKKKGRFAKWMASIFMSDIVLKQKVEQEVCNQIALVLDETLILKLKEEGVEAKVTVSVKNKS